MRKTQAKCAIQEPIIFKLTEYFWRRLLVGRQSDNLEALGSCLQDYSEIVRALDADVYLKLQQFIAFKGVGLDWIAILLRRGMIPFDGLNLEDIKRLARYSQYMLRENVDVEDVDPISDMIDTFLLWYHEVGVISRRMDASAFELTALFDQGQLNDALKTEELQRLNDFLKRNDLVIHLDEAKRHLNQIRQFIQDNVSVADIMIDVGSEQLKMRTRCATRVMPPSR